MFNVDFTVSITLDVKILLLRTAGGGFGNAAIIYDKSEEISMSGIKKVWKRTGKRVLYFILAKH